jgi:beta-galactosidase
LKAVAYQADAVVAQSVLTTTGPAAAIRLTPDQAVIHAARDSLCYVTVEVVDADGCRDPNGDQQIYFTVQGAGEIAAVGSGDPTSEERYRGNQRRAYQGRCVAVLRSNGESGQICLRAQADGLKVAQVVIETR